MIFGKLWVKRYIFLQAQQYGTVQSISGQFDCFHFLEQNINKCAVATFVQLYFWELNTQWRASTQIRVHSMVLRELFPRVSRYPLANRPHSNLLVLLWGMRGNKLRLLQSVEQTKIDKPADGPRTEEFSHLTVCRWKTSIRSCYALGR